MNYTLEELLEIGERRYFAFAQNITDKRLMTPHTTLLGKFSILDARSDEFVTLALNEILQNFDE